MIKLSAFLSDSLRYKVIIKDSESVKTYTGISQNGNKV